MALAFALFIFAIIAVFADGWMAPFVVTPRFLMILVAAMLLGAFATIRKDQAGSRNQIIALIIAVALVLLTRFIPNTTLHTMEQYWLPMYAGVAVIGALVLRRSMIPKS